VLTVPEDAAFPVRDPSLLSEVPAEAKVFRSRIAEFYGLYRRATGATDLAAPVNLSTSARPGRGAREKLLSSIRGALFIPDGRVGWLPAGSRAALRIARREKPDLVFASGPPFTAHWIGRRVAERTPLPLVLDFRDPWTQAPFYPARPAWARRIDERLEASCVRRASAVITVNRQIRDDLLSRIPSTDPGRIHVLTNGFDPADFAGREARPAPQWTLTHTGTLPGHGLPSGLAEALRILLREDPALADQIRIRFVGVKDPGAAEGPLEPPLDRLARVEGYLPHGESVQALLDSQCLLLLIEEGPMSRGILTGKLFEYLGSGRPILALAPEGEAAELIRETRAGRVVRSGDAEAIARALREALRAHREGRRAFGDPDPDAIARFARPGITRRLAEVFESVLASH
jgi:glycosyltransferase involved in cell wall biosynthesis